MKKILLFIACVMACMTVNAQAIKIYEGETLKAVYFNTASNQYKVKFSKIPSGSIGVAADGKKWVQLWAGGPKWAEYNLGADGDNLYGSYYQWGTETDDLGNYWETPTEEQLSDLVDSGENGLATWEWTKNYGPGVDVAGYWVSGVGAYKNNNVFFPAASDEEALDEINKSGLYWSSDWEYGDDGYEHYFYLGFDSENYGMDYDPEDDSDETMYLSIRPVLNE